MNLGSRPPVPLRGVDQERVAEIHVPGVASRQGLLAVRPGGLPGRVQRPSPPATELPSTARAAEAARHDGPRTYVRHHRTQPST